MRAWPVGTTGSGPAGRTLDPAPGGCAALPLKPMQRPRGGRRHERGRDRHPEPAGRDRAQRRLLGPSGGAAGRWKRLTRSPTGRWEQAPWRCRDPGHLTEASIRPRRSNAVRRPGRRFARRIPPRYWLGGATCAVDVQRARCAALWNDWEGRVRRARLLTRTRPRRPEMLGREGGTLLVGRADGTASRRGGLESSGGVGCVVSRRPSCPCRPPLLPACFRQRALGVADAGSACAGVHPRAGAIVALNSRGDRLPAGRRSEVGRARGPRRGPDGTTSARPRRCQPGGGAP